LKGASASVNGGIGGTDFDQLGIGTETGSILSNQQQGSLQTTNLPTDIAIEGDGFFIVNDGAGNHYTRDANFLVDGFGNINQASTGFHLQGYGIKQVGNTVTIDNTKVQNLTVPQQVDPADQTNIVDLIGNLQSSTTQPQTQSIGVYDSLGQLHNVVLTFTPSGLDDGNWSVAATAADLTAGSSIMVNGGNTTSSIPGEAGLHFNSLGQLDGTITPLFLTFVAQNTPPVTVPGTVTVVQGPPAPTAAPEPWVIPGTLRHSNAQQSGVVLNLNDPNVGNLTQFASATAVQTQAAPNTSIIPNIQNPQVLVTGNLLNLTPPANTGTSAMGTVNFVAQDSTGETHNFQVGLITNDGLTFTPNIVSVDGFSGVANGNMDVTTAAQQTVQLSAYDSNGVLHQYQLELVPNAGVAGINDNTVWAGFIDKVDDANGIPVAGNLTNTAAVGATTPFTFKKLEPDGVNHQFDVTLTWNGATWDATSVTVDGQTNANVTLASTSTSPLDVNIAANTFKNGVAEDALYDFANVSLSASPTSLSASVINPSTTIDFDPNDSATAAPGSALFRVISGGALTFDVVSNSLPISNQMANGLGVNAAQKIAFDFSQVTNDATTGQTMSTTLAPTADLPASISGANLVFPQTTTSANASSGQHDTITISANAFGNNNSLQTLDVDLSRVTSSANASGLIGPLAGTSGHSAGTLKDFNVDQTGIIHGVYTNGFTQAIGQILLATFENPGGLQREGHNNLQISANSGVVNVGTPGTGKLGTIAEGNIETS